LLPLGEILGVNIGRQFVLSNARLFVHQVDLADPGVHVRCTKVSPDDGVHQMDPCIHAHPLVLFIMYSCIELCTEK